MDNIRNHSKSVCLNRHVGYKIPCAVLYAVSMVGVWLLTRSLHWGIKGSANLLLQILLGIVIFEGRFKRKVAVTLLVSLVVLLVDLCVAAIAGQTSYIDPANPSASYYVLAIASRVIYASILGCIVLIYRVKLIHTHALESFRWHSIIGFSLLPVLAAVAFIELYRKTEPFQETLLFAFCAFLMVLMYFLSMNLQLKVFEVIEQRNISSFANREMAVRKENYQSAQKLHQEIYKMAHDLKHQIVTLEELYGHSSEARRFIDQMKIRLLDTLEDHRYNNLVIESTLKGYVQKAIDAGIEVELDADVYDEVKIQMLDLSTILGNIFDNAIESCQRITDPAKPKKIKCNVTLQKTQLMITMENTVGGLVRKEGKRFVTSKTDSLQHGIGLVSVEQTVKKYFGFMEAYEKDGIFHFDAVLNNVKIEK